MADAAEQSGSEQTKSAQAGERTADGHVTRAQNAGVRESNTTQIGEQMKSGLGPGGAWRSRRAWVIMLVVAVVGLVADLASKYAAFRHIAPQPVMVVRDEVIEARGRLGPLIPFHEPVVVVPHVLELKLVLNPGAVFGMGAGKRWFFVGFTLAAVGFVLWIFSSWTRPRDWLAHAAIGLVLAGGVGNLYDRLIYACVRDFLHPLPGVLLPFGWKLPWGEREVWPYVSNVADAFLIVGILVLMVQTWRAGGAGEMAKLSNGQMAK
jgi:signal peptidase II